MIVSIGEPVVGTEHVTDPSDEVTLFSTAQPAGTWITVCPRLLSTSSVPLPEKPRVPLPQMLVAR